MSRDRGIDVLTGVAASPGLPDGWRVITAGPIDSAVDRGAFDALVDTGRIDHRGVLAPHAARDLLVTARVGLLPLLPTPAYAASIPTKLFEYLAAGLAVVATDVPLWRELLDGADCATWVPPGDPEAVVAALRRYDGDPDLLRRHAEAGRAMVLERFRWDHEEHVLLDLYRSLSGASPMPEAVGR
jgi:glycosyltransferase involved in cell wall biosynthesis